MAVPKNRASKARTRRKHSINGKLILPKIVENKESGAMVRSHRLDSSTGVYNGLQVVEIKE